MSRLTMWGALAGVAAAACCAVAISQDTGKKAPAAKAADDHCAQAMAMGIPGEHHKQLEYMVGEWNYTCKVWMDPSAPPNESTGVCNSRSLMDGRFIQSDHSGKFKMPGADGSMMDFDFKGMALTGYDNARKCFVGAWIDNMSTSIMNTTGTYDASSKTYTYVGESEEVPGVTVKIRETIRIIDKDKHTFEFYRTMDGKEIKVMELTYTRKKSA
ncbi:MAG: DUF1579 domain-containing protein [Phycisphaerales bacterium]|nr:DUF1579 domain-containing protein [Phycisphaerales bacterium]